MICDDNEPVAIAGIMGGELSEIVEDTDSLLLESANFDAASVRRSSTRLGYAVMLVLDMKRLLTLN